MIMDAEILEHERLLEANRYFREDNLIKSRFAHNLRAYSLNLQNMTVTNPY